MNTVKSWLRKLAGYAVRATLDEAGAVVKARLGPTATMQIGQVVDALLAEIKTRLGV